MQHVTMCLHSHCTTTGFAMTLELVVGLTLPRTVLVEFLVDEVAVRQIFSMDTVVSLLSIFQLFLHTQLVFRKHYIVVAIESVIA